MSFTTYPNANYGFSVDEIGNQVSITNSLSRTIEQFEIVFLGGYLGIVADFGGIEASASGKIELASQKYQITTNQVEATDTFTAGNTAYFLPGTSAAGTIVDASATGAVPLGIIISSEGSAGAQTAVTVRLFDEARPTAAT